MAFWNWKTGAAVLAASTALLAQGQPDKLALTLPYLLSTGNRPGITLPNPTHDAHFDGSFQSTVFPLNSSVASQITRLPIASPASGFTYTFDPSLGAPTRSSQSFGPVLTERAETIGRGHLFFALTYQYFSFDQLDGLDLNKIPAAYHHVATTSPFGNDYISTVNSIDLKVNQATAFATVGLTDRVDLSVAVPMLNVHLGATSDANIMRLYSPPPGTAQPHYFDASDPQNSTARIFGANHTASGIGDVLVRAKWTVRRFEQGGFALAADVRTPTGDAYNLLGSGAAGIKPFAALSLYTHRVAPHFNLGYQWNGSSVLAGNNIVQGAKGHLPNSLDYAAGFDIGATRRVTFAMDVLGNRIFKGTRIFQTTRTDANGGSYQDINVQQRTSFNMANGAVGAKINLGQTLLLTANAIFRLNDAGLRAKVIPLVGLSYGF